MTATAAITAPTPLSPKIEKLLARGEEDGVDDDKDNDDDNEISVDAA